MFEKTTLLAKYSSNFVADVSGEKTPKNLSEKSEVSPQFPKENNQKTPPESAPVDFQGLSSWWPSAARAMCYEFFHYPANPGPTYSQNIGQKSWKK